MDSYVGFDSAWTDNSKAPGAICAVSIEADGSVRLRAPRLTSFGQALAFIRDVHFDDVHTLIALAQPTMVLNLTSMRPVERVVALLISWVGGGVQPSNRGKLGMFCDASPIWPFLTALGAVQEPEQARTAARGLCLMEVFPALAIVSLDPGFFGRGCAPRYNPQRSKTFRAHHWVRTAEAAAQEADALGCEELAAWCRDAGRIAQPRKADQEMLDSALCALVALRWQLRPHDESVLLGNLSTGYMVLPATPEVQERLGLAARTYSVPLDGTCPP